jgi:hypothetical protein
MDATTAVYARFFSMRSAICSSRLLRVTAADLPQVLEAAWAASNASPMSAALDLAALAKTNPSMGDALSKYWPPIRGTNLLLSARIIVV